MKTDFGAWMPRARPSYGRLSTRLFKAWRFLALSTALLLPVSAHAVTVLLYYATADPWNGVKMAKLRALLQTKYGAGNVTVINTGTTLYDPTGDAWGSYDQVWDLRFREANTSCPYTYTAADWDYFSAAWQAKAQSYLQSCGNFFVYGENSGFPAKFQGVSTFLNTIGATNSINTCNGSTGDAYQDTPDTLTSTLPGTTQLYTWAYGGIPVSKLNGTSYVTQAFSSDGIVRSVAAGWSGSAQMTSIGGTACNIGRLFTTWDQSMWQSDKYDSNATGKAITDAFYNGVADYLGASNCSCGTPTFTPTATRTATKTATRTATRTPTQTSSLTATRTATPTFTLTSTRSATPTATPSATLTVTPTATRSVTASATLTATRTVTLTATRTATPTATLTVTPSATLTVTRTATRTATASATLTATPSATLTATRTETRTASPSSTLTSTPTATPSATLTATRSVTLSATPTASPTMTPSVTGSMTPSQTPSASATQTRSASPTQTASSTRTASPTASPTATPSFTASPVASDTVSPTVTPTFTATPSQTPSATRTVSPSASPSATPSRTNTATPSATPSATASATLTSTPTASPTATPSFTASPVASDTVSPTVTSTYTASPTATSSGTRTASPTVTPTETPSATVTATPSHTPTASPTPTFTPTSTDTPLDTFTSTPTASPTHTPSPSRTASPTWSASPSATASHTPSPTRTDSPTQSATRTGTPSATPSASPTASWTASPTRTASPTVTLTPVPLPLRMTLTLYNSAGEVVRRLFEGGLEAQPSELTLSGDTLIPGQSQVAMDLGALQYLGQGSLAWDGANDSGQASSAGLYYFKAEFVDNYGKTQSLIKEVQVFAAPKPPTLEIYNSAGELVLRQPLSGSLAGSTGLRLDGANSAIGEGGKLRLYLTQGNGESAWDWDGRNSQGALVASGSYLVKLVTEGPNGARSVQSKDLVLLRAPDSGSPCGTLAFESNPLRPGQALALRFAPDAGLDLRVRVYNLAGERISGAQGQGGSGRLQLEASNWASGIYLVEVELYQAGARLRRTVLKLGVVH